MTRQCALAFVAALGTLATWLAGCAPQGLCPCCRAGITGTVLKHRSWLKKEFELAYRQTSNQYGLGHYGIGPGPQAPTHNGQDCFLVRYDFRPESHGCCECYCWAYSWSPVLDMPELADTQCIEIKDLAEARDYFLFCSLMKHTGYFTTWPQHEPLLVVAQQDERPPGDEGLRRFNEDPALDRMMFVYRLCTVKAKAAAELGITPLEIKPAGSGEYEIVYWALVGGKSTWRATGAPYELVKARVVLGSDGYMRAVSELRRKPLPEDRLEDFDDPLLTRPFVEIEEPAEGAGESAPPQKDQPEQPSGPDSQAAPAAHDR